jgi:hypothetical protein
MEVVPIANRQLYDLRQYRKVRLLTLPAVRQADTFHSVAEDRKVRLLTLPAVRQADTFSQHGW